MNRLRPHVLPFLTLFVLSRCAAPEPEADAYGYFEATKITLSAEQGGKLLYFLPEEGEALKKGQIVGLVDTLPLHLQKKQLEARAAAVLEKTRDASPQIAVLEARKRGLEREQSRLQQLLQEEAATPQQLDEMNTQLDVTRKEMRAVEAEIAQVNRGVLAELKPLRAQLDQVTDQLSRCRIVNPQEGTVLRRLAEPGELVSPGRALYQLADLEELELRAYLDGSQLSGVKLGQDVSVAVDLDENQSKYLSGTISWISSEAEFTPKNVQTREDAVGLVYAVKVRVKNDGYLRIGMPGKVMLNASPAASTQKGS